MIEKKTQAAIKKAAKTLWGIRILEVHLEHPQNPNHGDFATNVALISSRTLKQSPMAIAKQLVAEIAPKLPLFKKIEVAPPGFINMTLRNDLLLEEVRAILKVKDTYGSGTIGKGKRILLEHTSPNTNKALHLGHVKNNILGMAVGRILKFLGFKVVLACLYNDRGIHISKAMWGYLRHGRKKARGAKREAQSWRKLLDSWFDHQEEWLTPQQVGKKPDHFVEEFYVVGVKAESEAEGAKEEMQEMLRAWEAGDKKIRALWRVLNQWVYEGFKQTYSQLGSHHDVCWYESELYKKGKEMALEAVEKGILRSLPDGAVLSNLEEYNLPDTVIVRADGTTMYHTQDLFLTKLKREKYPSSLYIWDVGPEQELYLEQLFAICEQLGMGKLSDYFHLSYGFVLLRGVGKMSSRAGTVVRADEIIDLMHKKAKEVLAAPSLGRDYLEVEKEKIAEAVGIGALKYGMLKSGRLTETHFDPEESLSFEGNSGPYLQYTCARAQSVLRKAGRWKWENDRRLNSTLSKEETLLLRTFYKFPEVVEEAGKAYAPNLICGYLFDLAQKFNLFYEKQPIIKAESEDLKKFRLALTAAVSIVLKNGLNLLGIKVLEKM